MTKGGKTFAYSYGADGVRTQKTIDGVTTEYYTVGGKLLAEKTGDRVLTFYYDDKGAPVSVELNGTRYYYYQNLQGDVIGLYSTTGAVVAEYTYDPWGKLLNITDTSGTNIGTLNPLRYRGYYYDTETGFYFLQSRYYDPTVGRFINADDMLGGNGDIQSYNLFAYCSNDPINHSDPSGTVVDLVFEAGAVAIVIIAVGLIVITTAAISLPASPSVAIPGSNDVIDGLRRSLGTIRDSVTEGIENLRRGTERIARDITQEKVDPVLRPKKRAIFTLNPYDFKPRGSVMREFAGTSNGRIIEWRDPVTGIVMFEWDENLNHFPHYHALIWDENHHGVLHNGTHYLPGSLVPEPLNSLYFGG